MLCGNVGALDHDDDIAAHLARNLGSLRHSRSLTQDALATAAKIPRSTVANRDSGMAAGPPK